MPAPEAEPPAEEGGSSDRSQGPAAAAVQRLVGAMVGALEEAEAEAEAGARSDEAAAACSGSPPGDGLLPVGITTYTEVCTRPPLSPSSATPPQHQPLQSRHLAPD